jgi:thiamine biosynthesis lipoprotein
VSRPALGTWVRVVVHGESPERASTAIDAAFDAIRGVDAEMSIHRADSVLARLNASAGRGPVTIPDSLRQVLMIGLDFSRRSVGVYDPTILPLMRLWGFYGNERHAVPPDREIAAALDLTGIGKVLLDGATCGLSRAGMSLDLGSIGKGWALDRAWTRLRARVSSALVDVGATYGLGTPKAGPKAGPWASRIPRRVTSCARSISGTRLWGRARTPSSTTRSPGSRWATSSTRGAAARPTARWPSQSPRRRRPSDVLSTTAFLLGPSRFCGPTGPPRFPEATAVEFVG